MPERTQTRFAIIGAGAGGICAGIRLQETGRDDFVILDKEERVGGTWHRNTYPGAACDIASHLYCYSFAPNPDWSRPYAPQPEILAYLERTAREYGILDRVRLGTTVVAAVWDDATARWILTLDSGEELEAQFLIGAVGMFGEIAVPDIPGLDAFPGRVFHSAAWDHDHDLTGRRVGVIGSAASATQFVPVIAPLVEQLVVFQRTPNWVLPKDDTPYTPEQIEEFRAKPELMAERRQQLFEGVEVALTYVGRDTMRLAEQVGLAALEVVEDPVTRARLTPDHPFGCKRPLLSNDYLQTFNRPNVSLVVDPVEQVTADGVVTADGALHEVDTIVLATGFATTRYISAVDVTGRDGVRLDDAWADGPSAYLGVTTTGFPNLFMLYGPNTNGGNSIILMLEHQVEYLLRLVDALEAEGDDWLDVRPEVMDAYNATLQDEIDSVDVWQASCNGYYRSASGRIVTQWPHNFTEYRARTERVDLDSFLTGSADQTGATP